jgi:hypothetical protein
MSFPWWVAEKDQCIWCRKYNDLISVCVNDASNAVEMWYACDNPKCEHLEYFKVPFKICIIQEGKTAVEVFNKKMAEPEPKSTLSGIAEDVEV